MRGRQDTDPRGLATRSALSRTQIAKAWNIVPEVFDGEPEVKRQKREETEYVYDRNHFKMSQNWPKRQLEHFRKKNEKIMKKPEYKHRHRISDSRFQATLTIM